MKYAILLLALFAASAHAAGFWTRVATPTNVEVELHIVSKSKMNRLRGYITMGSQHGYSVLTVDRTTDEWCCNIYVTDDHPKIIEHELRHCDGWTHD